MGEHAFPLMGFVYKRTRVTFGDSGGIIRSTAGVALPMLGTDHLNFWGGGWVIFGETVFFFSYARTPGNDFFDRLKDRIFFFRAK